MKSKCNPGEQLYQLVVQDYRQSNAAIVDSFMDGANHVDRLAKIPERTLLRWARSPQVAIDRVKKFGSVISCHKVDAHYRLEMIEHLNLKQKPIAIDMVGEQFEITPELEISKSEIGDGIAVDLTEKEQKK